MPNFVHCINYLTSVFLCLLLNLEKLQTVCDHHPVSFENLLFSASWGPQTSSWLTFYKLLKNSAAGIMGTYRTPSPISGSSSKRWVVRRTTEGSPRPASCQSSLTCPYECVSILFVAPITFSSVPPSRYDDAVFFKQYTLFKPGTY